ncbi:hypothetical protein [Flagellimonas meishanensis]|uniref:hypothetical protein n=1 Tax=Flagellimonas meishanensis TaxID=2873264 RepID=UPI001CA71941|nr:hypothetical protein [[Muricauda] meishanensis]
MVIKFIESTYDSVKDKLKNPFYGTLFVVWVIRNREFIYNVFFNEDCTSDQRLEIIRSHFLNWDSLQSFIETIFISLGLMVLIYASLNLSRFIVEFSERKLKPWIQKLFSSTSIVSREDFQAMEKERDYFQKKYSEERIEKIGLQRELDQLQEQKIIKVDSPQNSSSTENFKARNDSENKAKKIVDRWKRLRPSYFEDFKTLMKHDHNKLTVSLIESTMKDLASIREFKDKGIIETIDHNNFYYYNFTEFGDEFVHYVSNMLSEKT